MGFSLVITLFLLIFSTTLGRETECVPPAGDDNIFQHCPMADCLPVVVADDCQYVNDKYVIDEMTGKCCPKQCYMENSEGVECTASEPGSSCDANSAIEVLCPVAKCMEPPDGCNYIFDKYVVNNEGLCCPKLCYAVDSKGDKCDLMSSNNDAGDPITIAPTVSSTTLEPGSECDTKSVMRSLCPKAKCIEPKDDCEYVFDKYVVNNDGLCCPKMCYAVDSKGNECNMSFNNTKDTSSPEEGTETECIPLAGDDIGYCPIADCMPIAVADDCQYVNDKYIIDEITGKCCPKQCYMENSEGVECTALEPGSDCDADAVVEAFCPVAGCADAEDGCEYVFDKYTVNYDGLCCPKMCYAVDSKGNECTVPVSASVKNQVTMVSIAALTTIAVTFLL